MDQSSNPASRQRSLQRVAVQTPDDKEMPNRIRPLWNMRQHERTVAKGLQVGAGTLGAPIIPVVQASELDPQHSSLDWIEFDC